MAPSPTRWWRPDRRAEYGQWPAPSFDLRVPDTALITVEKPAPADPFQIPVRTSSALLYDTPNRRRAAPLPGMDGIETTRAIRDWEAARGGRLPIPAMTAHAMKGDEERFLAAGMDGYLAKPIHPRELMERIAALGV